MSVTLGVNLDHIATLREARKIREPDPVAAAVVAELAGADGITVHLRADRRHIQERDVRLLRQTVATHLTLQMAPSEEMVAFAVQILPDIVTLVPESSSDFGVIKYLNRQYMRFCNISKVKFTPLPWKTRVLTYKEYYEEIKADKYYKGVSKELVEGIDALYERLSALSKK